MSAMQQKVEVVRRSHDGAVLRRLFTVEDYHRMADVGLLDEDEHTELLEGEVVYKMPIGSRHGGCVKRLIRILVTRLADRAIIGAQDPVRLDRFTEPEPDIAVLKSRADTYSDSHPGPDDVLFLIEVADSSLFLDREVKALLYAAAGIPELWIVDLSGDSVDVLRDPAPGGFRRVEHRVRGDHLTPVAFPDVTVPVDEVLGPPV